MMGFGDKIHELRIKNGLTLQEVGDKIGVGASTVRKWENGIISNVRQDKIRKIADALGTSPAFLMGWEKYEFLLNETEAHLIDVYRDATPEQRQLIIKLVEVVANDGR